MIGIEASLEELIALRREAEQLHFSARKISQARQMGQKHSHFRGRGMEYFESRHYVEGDDMRHIDWRVTARTDKLHSKVFIEERERPILIVADFSSSMYFGTRQSLKTVVAAKMAALLAWYLNKQGDRVGGLLFTPDTEVDIRPASGRRSVLSLLSALSEATGPAARFASQSQHENRLTDALLHAARVARPGSLVLLFSDFYAASAEPEQENLRQALHQLAASNDVLGFFVSDPLERQLSASLKAKQAIPMVNSSSDKLSQATQRLWLRKSNSHASSKVEQHFKRRESWLRKEFGQLGLPVIPLSTTDGLVEALNRPVLAHG